MAREYVPIFFDWLETTQDLTAEEKGNLIDAVVSYASGQEYEHLLTGGCKIAFRFLKGQVDRNAAISDVRSKAGGNKKEQTQAKANKRQQMETNGNKPEQTQANSPKEEEKEEEKENKNKEESSYTPQDDFEAEAIQTQQEHDQILQASENAGFPRNNIVRSKLLDAYAIYGKDKVLRAIEQCALHSATSIAYLQAVLSDKPRPGQGKPARTVVAQQYDQRDYSGQMESVEDVLTRMEMGQRATG